MKSLVPFFVAFLLASPSLGKVLVCHDDFGNPLAVMGPSSSKSDLILEIKLQQGFRKTFTATEISKDVFQGSSGLFGLKPVLDLKSNTLKTGSKTVRVACAPYQD